MPCGEPCSCFNESTYEPCTENNPCCDQCPDGSPCAYAILAKCEWGHTGDEFFAECPHGLVMRHITMLWRDCQFSCDYSARVCLGDPNPNPSTTCCFTDEDWGDNPANHRCGCSRCLPTGYVDNDCFSDFDKCLRPYLPHCTVDGERTYLRPMQFGCGRFPGNNAVSACGWDAEDYEGGYHYLYTFKVWTLEISGGTATINAYGYETGDVGNPRTPVLVATFVCDTFDCLGRNDFVRTVYTEAFDGFYDAYMPKQLCVVPYSSRWETPCSSNAAACACCDSGADTASLDIDLGDCGGLFEDVAITRNATLPSGVTNPSGACGYFWGTFGGCDGFNFGVLTYCDGTDWHVDLWCSHGGWHEIDTATATLTQCCPGAAYTWTWSGDWGDCCCRDPVETTCCEGEGIPGTLYATITATGCEIDGEVVTIGYDGLSAGTHNWSGSFSASCGTMTLTISMIEATCRMAFGLKIGSNTCASGTGSGVPVPCPFTSETVTGNWLNPPCGCCTNGTGISIEVSA